MSSVDYKKSNESTLDYEKIKRFLSRHTMEIILLALIVFCYFFAPGFSRFANLIGILRAVSITGVIAFGMTMVIIGGEIDLSVGSSIALSSVMVTWTTGTLHSRFGMSMEVGVIFGMLAALSTGLVVGFFNGYVRTRFKMPSFIITLAMLNVLFGVSAIISGGFPLTTLPQWYRALGSGTVGRIPVPAIWLLVVFAIVLVIMNYTKFGREVYAVGGNLEAARLSGININRIKIIIMMMVQFLAAIAGIILSAQVQAGSSTFGRGNELDVISAVIVGGASLNGGKGRVWGTFVGILFLGVIMNAMTLFGIDDFVKHVVRGGLILGAVLLYSVQQENLKKA